MPALKLQISSCDYDELRDYVNVNTDVVNLAALNAVSLLYCTISNITLNCNMAKLDFHIILYSVHYSYILCNNIKITDFPVLKSHYKHFYS